VEWKVFNAGPSAMEALLAGALDIAYVGPNPALNAYLRSSGTALRIVAGAASGGASLVVHQGSPLRYAADFRGRRLATPEYGNTQDLSLRHWLREQGLNPKKDVRIMPVKNAEILDLFQQKKISGAWVPEPWATRLVQEAGGSILLDERSLWADGRFPTAVVVVRAEFLAANRELVKRFLEAHVETTESLAARPAQGRRLVNTELGKLSRRPLADKVVDDAFTRLTLTWDPSRSALLTMADRAKKMQFLPMDTAPLDRLFDLTLLNEVLAKRKLPGVK
jgi:NitT/TauT family transport system substrate-binding protein